MIEVLETLVLLSFALNPIFALIFILNLCSFIIKVSKKEYEQVRINIIFLCITFVFIIFALTWQFARLAEYLDPFIMD